MTLKYMIKYIHSEKGKSTRKKYLENNKEKMKEYRREYALKLRNECRIKKICIRCHKEKVEKGYIQCNNCLEQLRIMYSLQQKSKLEK